MFNSKYHYHILYRILILPLYSTITGLLYSFSTFRNPKLLGHSLYKVISFSQRTFDTVTLKRFRISPIIALAIILIMWSLPLHLECTLHTWSPERWYFSFSKISISIAGFCSVFIAHANLLPSWVFICALQKCPINYNLHFILIFMYNLIIINVYVLCIRWSWLKIFERPSI